MENMELNVCACETEADEDMVCSIHQCDLYTAARAKCKPLFWSTTPQKALFVILRISKEDLIKTAGAIKMKQIWWCVMPSEILAERSEGWRVLL